MNKFLIFAVVFLLLIVLACQPAVEQKQDSAAAEQIKEMYNKTEIVRMQVVATGDENSSGEIVFKETPVEACAIFTKDEGAQLCNMTLQASNYAENELHNTCNQVFRENKLPFNFVTIRTLEYKTNKEAKDKFGMDKNTYNGEVAKRNKFLFERQQPTKMAEFYKGRKIVRISDTGKACPQFDKLVDVAFTRS